MPAKRATRKKATQAARKAPAKGAVTGGGKPRRLALPDLFQRYFDRRLCAGGAVALRIPTPPTVGIADPTLGLDPRSGCCARLASLPDADALIGDAFAAIGRAHFDCTPEQADALAGWPPPQLRLFKAVLLEILQCPFPPGPYDGPHRPGFPGVPPGPPPPDPPPYRPTRARFRGRAVRGARPSLQVSMPGDGSIEITFIAPRIP